MSEPLPSRDDLDELVDVDPIFLRNAAFRLLAEVERLRTPPPPGELLGLETMCAALHAATETDPLVKEVAWRTFALIRAHREQSAEVDCLKAVRDDAHHDLKLCVGEGFTSVNSAAVEAVRRVAVSEAEVDRLKAELAALRTVTFEAVSCLNTVLAWVTP